MKVGHTCHQYTFEQISRFVDNELPQDRSAAVAAHCRQCPECRQTVEKLNAISNAFNSHVQQHVDSMDKTVIEKAVHRYRARTEKTMFGNIFSLLGQHLYVKLSFVTAILMIGVFMYNTMFTSPAGPSAIVKYVDTEMPSVMIIETEKQKHTIIWFSET